MSLARSAMFWTYVVVLYRSSPKFVEVSSGGATTLLSHRLSPVLTKFPTAAQSIPKGIITNFIASNIAPIPLAMTLPPYSVSWEIKLEVVLLTESICGNSAFAKTSNSANVAGTLAFDRRAWIIGIGRRGLILLSAMSFASSHLPSLI